MIGLGNGKMADLSKVHHIVIGYDKIEEYKININILRNVFVKGEDLLITAIYNGNNHNEIEEKYKSEKVNNFIILKENKGYVSWNTYRRKKNPRKNDPAYFSWKNNSVVVNPITWDNSISTELDQHKGFLFYDKNLTLHSVVDVKKF